MRTLRVFFLSLSLVLSSYMYFDQRAGPLKTLSKHYQRDFSMQQRHLSICTAYSRFFFQVEKKKGNR